MTTFFRRVVPFLLLVTCAGIALPSYAQYSGYYLELSGGPSEFDFFDFDDKGDFGRLTIGFRFNDNIAVEFMYVDYGDYLAEYEREIIDIDAMGSLVNFGFFPGSLSYSPTGFGAGVVGSYPFARYFDVYAKGGFLQWDMDIKQTQELPTDTFQASFDEEGTGLYLGAGIAINLSLYFSIRIEYEVHDWSTSSVSDNIKIDTSSIGIRYYF